MESTELQRLSQMTDHSGAFSSNLTINTKKKALRVLRWVKRNGRSIKKVSTLVCLFN